MTDLISTKRLLLRRWVQSDVAKPALRVGFEDHDLTEIFSFTSEKNLPSEAVMRRIGMQRRADLDFDHPKTPGWWSQPHIGYQLTRAEWRKSQIDLVVDL